MSEDIKEYLLGEPADRAAVESRLKSDPSARAEYEQLRLTRDLLRSALAEEEIPRRIAFVADPVAAEPKWWERIWSPGWGFAAASVLAGAIVAHGWLMKPDAVREVVRVEAGSAEVAAVIDAKVAEAVKQVRAESEERTVKMLEAAEQKYEFQRVSDLAAVEKNLDLMRREMNRNVMASFYGRGSGGAQ